MKKIHLSIGKKYLILPVMAFALAFTSCKKEEEMKEDPVKSNPSGETVPSSFTKKVMFEEFSGEWCGNCPDGVTYLDNMVAAHPGKVIIASVHQGDPFAISHYSTLNGFLNVTGFPRSAINRTPAQGTSGGSQNGLLAYSRGNWSTNANRELSKTAICGLKLETSVSGSNLSITVKCGANTSISGAKLTVYIVEDDVAESSPGAQAGAATGWKHKDLLRACLTNGLGDDIDLSSAELATKTYTADISSYTKANVKVIAFIHKHKTSPNDYEILNVQETHAGQTKNWD